MSNKFQLYLSFFLLLSGPVMAQDIPKFAFPVDCSLGQDCWTVNYVDMAPSDNALDFECKSKTYDDHKGTDFALRSLAEVKKGVSVLAAASGTVLRVRDGESDTIKSADELEEIRLAKRECGNAVLLDHGNGLRTLYCHLKLGSIPVHPKQKVETGDIIGAVGHSGLAEFPHLHFGIVWEGGMMDPYTGALSTDGCGKMKEAMWDASLDMPYEGLAVYDAGFRTGVPDFEAVKKGEENPDSISTDSDALVFWAAMYGIQRGDDVHLEITRPDGGTLAESDVIQEKTRARQYYYTGLRLTDETLAPGTYTGTIRIKRDDAPDITRTETITVR